ncbi:MAG: hypothetical protein AB8C13_02605 [Phycisphaerales bacterium]
MTSKTPDSLVLTDTQTTISDQQSNVIARCVQIEIHNLADQWSPDFADSTIIVRCGAHAGSDPEPSADLLAQWSQDSWEPFNESLRAINDLAEQHNTTVVIRPGAGGRLSDAICTLSWASTNLPSLPHIELLLDPAGWITPSMVSNLQDHLIRSTDLCVQMPSIWGVIVRSIMHKTPELLVEAPVGEGLIPTNLLDQTVGTIESPRVIRY